MKILLQNLGGLPFSLDIGEFTDGMCRDLLTPRGQVGDTVDIGGRVDPWMLNVQVFIRGLVIPPGSTPIRTDVTGGYQMTASPPGQLAVTFIAESNDLVFFDSGGGGGGGGGGRSVVFRPGVASNPAQGIFADWPTLYTALIALDGPKELIFDGTFGVPEITAGVWDLSTVDSWRGVGVVAPQVSFADGTMIMPAQSLTLTNILLYPLQAMTTPPIRTMGSGHNYKLTLQNSYLFSGDESTAPLYMMSSGSLRLRLLGNSSLNFNSYAAIGGHLATFIVEVYDQSVLRENSVTDSSPPSSTMNIASFSPAAFYPTHASDFFPFVSFSTSDQSGLAAPIIRYAPADPSRWTSPPPVNVQQALDDLVTGNGSLIPTQPGQLYGSPDGVRFQPVMPITAFGVGWLMNDQGYLLMGGG